MKKGGKGREGGGVVSGEEEGAGENGFENISKERSVELRGLGRRSR